MPGKVPASEARVRPVQRRAVSSVVFMGCWEVRGKAFGGMSLECSL
jgi:hypothetical protein